MPTYANDPTAKPMTLPRLLAMRTAGERITMLTCYDASFAALLDGCGVDTLLVGDSLGMVVQGHASTTAVRLADVIYHTRCVARAVKRAWIVADLPWATYHESPRQAFASAAELVGAGAQMVKIEGGRWLADTVDFLVTRGIAVCAHLGLTPQTAHQLGGFRVQAKSTEGVARLIEDARALQDAGAALVLVELVPAAAGKALTEALAAPTIGIGAGPHTSGQVLVLYDLLNIPPGPKPRFVRDFMAGADSVEAAIKAYVEAVKSGAFPAPEHCY